MAQQVITFDPDVAVPYGVNLTIFSGADFNTTFTVKTSAGSSIDFLTIQEEVILRSLRLELQILSA